MPNITKNIAEKFCEHCRWAQHVWQFRTYLFDDNLHPKLIKEAKIAPFFFVVHEMASEYWMLQVSKLHDPASTRGKKNLSLNFIIENWPHDQKERKELEEIKSEMDLFYAKIKSVRDKITAHIDMDIALSGEFLGGFPEDEDKKYFEHLKNFSEIVSRSVLERPFSYRTTTRTDVGVMMKRLRWAKEYSELPKH